MTMLTTLAEFFPEDADQLMATVQQAGEARIWGGIHFRHDIIAGEELGRQIGRKVLNSLGVIE